MCKVIKVGEAGGQNHLHGRGVSMSNCIMNSNIKIPLQGKQIKNVVQLICFYLHKITCNKQIQV